MTPRQKAIIVVVAAAIFVAVLVWIFSMAIVGHGIFGVVFSLGWAAAWGPKRVKELEKIFQK